MAVRDVSLLILYTTTGQILLQHRTPDAFSLPNHWAFFGGGIEAGESTMEALKREALEELSFHVQIPYFLMAQTVRDGEDLNTKYVSKPTPSLRGRTGDGMVFPRRHTCLKNDRPRPCHRSASARIFKATVIAGYALPFVLTPQCRVSHAPFVLFFYVLLATPH